MNQTILRKWMLANNVSHEELAVMLRASFYTVRKILKGERVNNSLVELLSIKTQIPVEQLLLTTQVSLTKTDVKNR